MLRRLPRTEPKNEGARALREWREREGLTQIKAARFLGMDPITVSRIERGSVPGAKNRDRLRLKLEIEPALWLQELRPQKRRGVKAA